MPQGNNDPDSDSGWQAQTNVANDTVRVPIVCKEHDRETWDQEATDQGYRNRSRYLYHLIQEARAYRDNEIRGPAHAEQRIQELQSEVEQLRSQLEQERKKSGGRPAIDDIDFLERFLADNYKSLEQILQEIVESGVLNDLIRKRVEDQLYFMASRDEVAFERGWGWKLADGSGDTPGGDR